jgi:ADP-heptose:LPS heptosyltransferase
MAQILGRMPAGIKGKSKPRSIIVMRALQLGDMLCAVPALRALRAACPSAHIALAALPTTRELLRRFPSYIDEFIPFPGFPGLSEVLPDHKKIPLFLKQLQARRFDLAIQMHGNGSIVNPLVELVGARSNAGYYRPGDYMPSGMFMPYPEHEPEILRALRLMEHIGVAKRGEQLEYPLLSEDFRRYARLEKKFALEEGGFVCLHPGARDKTRRWLPERFAAVGDELYAAGYKVVLTGSAEDRCLTTYVQRAMHFPSIDLAGMTNLGTLGAVIKKAKLVVCNDTVVSHIAAAFKTPSVVVVLASDPARWRPLDHQRHRVVYYSVKCRPCQHSECPIGHPCAHSIFAEEVILQSRILLEREGQ